MKKGLIVLSGILMALLVCGCNFSIKVDGYDNPANGTSEGGGQSQNLCTIKGKALYANSSDSSSIKVYIDKNEGVFTQPVLNMAFPNDLR